MRRILGAAIAAAIAALTIVAGTAFGLSAWPGSQPAAHAGEDAATVPAGEGARLGASLDPARGQALSDGQVTRGEYVAAVEAAVQCIRDSGNPVGSPAWEEGRYAYTAGPFPSREALVAAKPALAACYDANLRGVDLVWQASLAH